MQSSTSRLSHTLDIRDPISIPAHIDYLYLSSTDALNISSLELPPTSTSNLFDIHAEILSILLDNFALKWRQSLSCNHQAIQATTNAGCKLVFTRKTYQQERVCERLRLVIGYDDTLWLKGFCLERLDAQPQSSEWMDRQAKHHNQALSTMICAFSGSNGECRRCS